MHSVSSLILLAIPVALNGLICPGLNGNFNEDDQQEILDAHNIDLRSPIALGNFVADGTAMPAATNMRRMDWSCVLEQSAQAWADNCQFKFSGGDNGENLYIAYGADASPDITGSGKIAAEYWADEFQKQGWASINLTEPIFETGISHATQMAWWSSDNVGCGATQCPDNTLFVVCQYSPRGNIINSNVYEAGTTCSNCGNGYTCDQSTGLCGE